MTCLDSEEIKIRIDENKSSYDLIRSIDKANSGFIDFDNLSAFFATQKCQIQEEIVIDFLKRISKNEDLRIPKREFSSLLYPNSVERSRSKSRTPLKSIENDQFQSYKSRTPLRSIESEHASNYIPYNQREYRREAYCYNFSKTQPQEATLGNTLRLDTADFQYSENLDDPRTFDSIYESPIYKNNISKNVNLPLINVESQESLLELKNDLANPLSEKNGIDNRNKRKNEGKLSWKEKYKIPSFSKKLPVNDENTINDNLFTFKKKNRGQNSHLKEEFSWFAELMAKMLSLEKKTEKVKQDLALRPDFNLLDFFVIFDKNQKGYLTLEEVEAMFIDLNIKASPDEVSLFLKRFDRSNFGKLK